MIPAEAIEAARPWITTFLERRGLVLRGKEAEVLAGYILEAAAPHMRADAELQWGVRDTDPRCSSVVAVHPTEESARAIVAEHPDWYELVSRERPEAEPQWRMTP